MSNTSLTERVLTAIRQERARQDDKWGEQNHASGMWSLILAEELGEAAKDSIEGDRVAALTELVESAAVIVAWIECLTRQLEQEIGAPPAITLHSPTNDDISPWPFNIFTPAQIYSAMEDAFRERNRQRRYDPLL